MITFGPVPSRRLGRSLGINTIPAKVCSYDCIYCQLGRTGEQTIERRTFYPPQEVAQEVGRKIASTRNVGERVDYLTVVPDGEPSLDVNLGGLITMLQPLASKVAVITNASLAWREDVRRDLSKCDWISLKIDAADEDTWHLINRPHPALAFDALRSGISSLAAAFPGELTTETMLVKDVNDSLEHAQALTSWLAAIRPATAYVTVPTRPPAEKMVRPPEAERIEQFCGILERTGVTVVPLTEEDEGVFVSSDEVARDILAITSVHPMEEAALRGLLEKRGADWTVVTDLVARDELRELHHGDTRFFRRSFHHLESPKEGE